MHHVAIALGANLGQPLETLRAAWQDIRSCPCLVPLALSSPYSSEPLDMDSARWFVNAAALLQTALPPHDLLQLLHQIEQRFGRRRRGIQDGYHDRTLDLDLLLYEDLLLCDEHLSIPHPRMTDRLFVLLPLAEIAAEYIHPGCGLTIMELTARLYRRQPNQKIETIRWVTDPARSGFEREKRFGTGQIN